MFSVATSVTANSEATLELARFYGRSDAVLVPNGCDPARFSSVSEASGPITVGYLGKIGNRLDAKLIGDTVTAIPQVNFVFAGPVLEREVLRSFAHKPNVRMLGDIHYEEVPKLLQTFDIGWVPHGVESGQVGGDAIKIYEYRAAGLPVVTTPIIGTRERPMPYVNIAESTQHTDTITRLTAGYSRVPRAVSDIPFDMTWESKAQYMLDQLA
jgi:glycosyltransferase involved in cell wall biosynthesis